jgi:hypothetical protein
MSKIVNLVKSKLFWTAAVAVAAVLLIALSGKKPVSVKAVDLKPGELRVIVNATTPR